MAECVAEIQFDRWYDEPLIQQPQSGVALRRLQTRFGPAGARGLFAAIGRGRCSACHVAAAAVRLHRAKQGEFIQCASSARIPRLEPAPRI